MTCLEIEVFRRPPVEQFSSIFKVHNAEVAPATLEEGLAEANPAGKG